MRAYEYLTEFKAYHGSGNKHAGFDTSHTGKNSHTFGLYNSTRHGTSFTSNPEFAALYGDVYQYELKVTNTLNLDDSLDSIYYFTQTELDRNIRLDAENILHSGRNIWNLFEDELGEEFTKYIEEQGYDSVSFTEYNEDDKGKEIESKTTIVFNPSKIEKNGQTELDLYKK